MLQLTDFTGENIVNEVVVAELNRPGKDGETLLDRLFRIYRDESPLLLSELKETHAARDGGACYDVIHQIKGSASAMGATRLFLATEEALHYSKKGMLFEIEGLVPQIEEYSLEFLREMESSLAPR